MPRSNAFSKTTRRQDVAILCSEHSKIPKMRLFLLTKKRIGRTSHISNMLVCAQSEFAARMHAAHQIPKLKDGSDPYEWSEMSITDCTFLGTAHKSQTAGVILADNRRLR